MDAKDNNVLPEALVALTDTDTDFTFVLIPYWAKLLASSDETEKVIELRYEAMKSLTSRLASYKCHGYIEKLLCAIYCVIAKYYEIAPSEFDFKN